MVYSYVFTISLYIESFSANTDEAIAITMQQKELRKYKMTGGDVRSCSFNDSEGSRILFLDGGGMRGLIQIEILQQLEQRTGRKVTELFDWIVGTSTGGIVALALVYGKLEDVEVIAIVSKLCFVQFVANKSLSALFQNEG